MTKSTKKTTRKRTTKRRKKTTKSEQPTTPTEESSAPADDAAAAEATDQTAEKATKKTKRRTRKTAKTGASKKTTKRATRKRTKKESPPTAAPSDEQTESDATGDEPAKEYGVSRHERADGSVVLRFPPAAPSPFSEESLGLARAAEAPAVDAAVEEAFDESASFRAEEDDDDDDEEAIAEQPAASEHATPELVREEVETDETETDTPEAAEAPETEKPAQPLSRSQKRRLRRKRRRQSNGDETPESADDRSESDEGDVQVAEASPAIEEADAADVDIVEPETDETEEADETPDREKTPRRRRRGGRRRRKKSDDETPAESAEAPEAAQPADDEAEPVTGDQRKMIINYIPRDECRIAILENGRLEQIHMERASYENHVGSIYKGVVTNVESSIQAAFVDFGLGKNGFLHITDLHPDYMSGEDKVENVGRKMPRRARPPIQKCLKRGQEVIVQITKEGIGTKGPTLSTYLSIPGRFLVMMPGMRKLGISRKIEDEDARKELRGTLRELELPDDIGFIARTAAQGRDKKELQSDLNYLERLWRAVERRAKKEKAPTEVYRESDLVVRTIRDVFSAEFDEIIVDSPEVAERCRDFLSIFSPRSHDIVTEYTDPAPIFHRYKIEQELEQLHSRTVPLASGGSLVIEATEALVAIDVNSGRFRTEDDAESTAFKLNLEAADEIARQLRLRDMGGVVCCDFIDMRSESHKRKVERRLIGLLKKHKERAKVLRMSEFGIIELTRQRQRSSFSRNFFQDCPHCRGSGLVKTIESVVIDVIRMIQYAATRDTVTQIEVTLNPEVATLLQNRKRSIINELERSQRRAITIRPNPSFGPDQIDVQCYDQRARIVPFS